MQVALKECKTFETHQVAQHIQAGSQQMIEQCDEQLRKIKAQIDQCLEENPQLMNSYKLLLSVPGIGRQNSLSSQHKTSLVLFALKSMQHMLV